MPVVKKLRYDLDGDGVLTEIKVSVNSKGEFSADVPLYLKSCTHKVVVGLSTLYDAVSLVNEIVAEYQQLKRTEKWVILIEFKKDRQPFLNEGIGMKLNYILANKKQFGKQVSYAVINKDMEGNYREIGNCVPFSDFGSDGIIAGKCLEIDYTEEKIRTIQDIHSKLRMLCSMLAKICNNESQLMQLVGDTFKLLGNAETEEQ